MDLHSSILLLCFVALFCRFTFSFFAFLSRVLSVAFLSSIPFRAILVSFALIYLPFATLCTMMLLYLTVTHVLIVLYNFFLFSGNNVWIWDNFIMNTVPPPLPIYIF